MTSTPSIEQELTTFQEAYTSLRACRYDNMLVYTCNKGLVKICVGEANELIKRLGLNLIAKVEGRGVYSVSEKI